MPIGEADGLQETEAEKTPPDTAGKSEDDLFDLIDNAEKTEKTDAEKETPPAEEETPTDEKQDTETGKETAPQEEEKSFDDLADEDETDATTRSDSAAHTWKELKKAFPAIQKQFPSVQSAIFKSHQYDSLFASVEDAEEMLERQGVYDKFDAEIGKGNIKPLIEVLRKNNPKALDTIVDGFLDVVGDPKLIDRIVEPKIREILHAVIEDGENSENKNLQLAGKYIAQWLYGKSGLPARGTKTGATEDPKLAAERQALADERAKLHEGRFAEVQDAIIVPFKAKIMSYLESQIDPDSRMSSFTRTKAAEEAHARLDERLQRNEVFMRQMRTLWNKIKSDPSLAESVGPSIKRAFLGSAKPYLPAIIAKARSEALGTRSNGNASEKSTAFSGGGSKSGSGGTRISLKGVDSRDIDFRKTTEDDILSGKFTPKRRG